MPISKASLACSAPDHTEISLHLALSSGNWPGRQFCLVRLRSLRHKGQTLAQPVCPRVSVFSISSPRFQRAALQLNLAPDGMYGRLPASSGPKAVRCLKEPGGVRQGEPQWS